jgi:hypothetical protein
MDVPSIVVTTAPAGRPAGGTAADPRAWVRGKVAVWPAPVPVEACRLEADGSTVVVLPVGATRASPVDGSVVGAIGEGAVAWITVAAVRLAAAHAEHRGITGEGLVRVEISGGGPFEVWNHDGTAFGPAGDRVATVRAVQGTVDLAACLGADLAGVVRPLVVGVLGQFGLAGSRHIEPGGLIRRRNFTGHDERIRDWTAAIGVPSAY